MLSSKHFLGAGMGLEFMALVEASTDISATMSQKVVDDGRVPLVLSICSRTSSAAILHTSGASTCACTGIKLEEGA